MKERKPIARIAEGRSILTACRGIVDAGQDVYLDDFIPKRNEGGFSFTSDQVRELEPNARARVKELIERGILLKAEEVDDV